MKKLTVLIIVLILAAGFVFAQDEGTGLSVGVEFGIIDVNKPDEAEDIYPYIMPMIIYENSFLDGALDLYTELDFFYGFTKEPDRYFEDDDDDVEVNEVNRTELYFNLGLAYHLGLGPASTISFLLENDNYIPITPNYDFDNPFDGLLTPGIKYTHATDFGDFYAQLDYPLYYRLLYNVDDFYSGLNFTIGWDSLFGFGFKFTEYNDITPEADWFNFIDLTLYYETGPIYAEVLAEIPTEDVDVVAVSITPWVEYYFNSFTFYLYCEFAGIGSDGDIGISPALGVKFSF